MSGRHATSCHACAISVGRSTKLKKTRTRPHHPGPFKEWQHPIVVDTGIIKLMTCSNIFTSVLAWSQAPQACSTSCLAHRFVQGSTTGNRLMISNRNMFHQGGSGRSDQATKSSGLRFRNLRQTCIHSSDRFMGDDHFPTSSCGSCLN